MFTHANERKTIETWTNTNTQTDYRKQHMYNTGMDLLQQISEESINCSSYP